MRKFARVSWTEGAAVRCYGRRLGLRANAPGLVDPLLPGLPPVVEHIGPRSRVDTLFSVLARADGQCSLYAGGRLLHRSSSLDLLRYELERFVDLYLAVSARNRLFVHAGVVTLDGNRALLLPGGSHSGKTMLVQALVERGAVYYSDDCAVIDEKGRVHPYARPLALRRGSVRQKIVPSPSAIGSAPLPVGTILFTRYEADAELAPQPLRAAPALLELFAHSLSARTSPAAAMKTLAKVARTARMLSGARGDAGRTADRILELQLG